MLLGLVKKDRLWLKTNLFKQRKDVKPRVEDRFFRIEILQSNNAYSLHI